MDWMKVCKREMAKEKAINEKVVTESFDTFYQRR